MVWSPTRVIREGTGPLGQGRVTRRTFTSGGGIPQAPSVPNISAPTSVVTPAAMAQRPGESLTEFRRRGGGETPAAPALTVNPWSQSALDAAVAGGAAMGQQGRENIDQAALMRTSAQQGYGGAGDILQTGFDPQDALYNRTLQRLQDQVRVGQSVRGTTMSPYGAGQEASALSDFNIDWENQQLQRQKQALQGYATGTGAATGTSAGASNIGGYGAGQIASEGALPYQQFDLQQTNDINKWLAIIGAGQTNYPLAVAQQGMMNYGGVPMPTNTSSGGSIEELLRRL